MRNKEIREIQREERDRTLAEIQHLPLPEQARADVLAVCATTQEALDDLVQHMDHPIDQRVVPTAMRIAADEFERLHKRFQQTGLMQPRQ